MSRSTGAPVTALMVMAAPRQVSLWYMRPGVKQAYTRAYMEAKQEFELLRGGVPFGRTRTMTGAEAEAANKKLTDAFTKGPPGRHLWEWKAINPKPVQKLCRSAARVKAHELTAATLRKLA